MSYTPCLILVYAIPKLLAFWREKHMSKNNSFQEFSSSQISCVWSTLRSQVSVCGRWECAQCHRSEQNCCLGFAEVSSPRCRNVKGSVAELGEGWRVFLWSPLPYLNSPQNETLWEHREPQDMCKWGVHLLEACFCSAMFILRWKLLYWISKPIDSRTM